MSNYTDYIETGVNKFVELQDTPNTYESGKYVKVVASGIDYGVVDTVASGTSGGGLNYNYYFDTATDGNVASGTVQFNSTNYPAVSKVYISYFDKDNNDLSNWINSWDDSDKSVKGTLTLQSATYPNKYTMFKLSETLDTTFGSGADGDVTISGSINLNTTAVASGRTYPDMVAYNVSTVGLASCQTTEAPNGIVAGDAVLLINLQGSETSQVDNVGNYEVFVVDSIISTTVSFKSNKTKLYGNNGGDSNIGTASHTQKVMLMRIPQYNTLTISSGASITGNAWDGTKYGVICFMAKDSASLVGDVISPLGYRGVTHNNGESYGAYNSGFTGGLGGGVYKDYDSHGSGGGGGAYGTSGAPGSGYGSAGGTAYGVASLSKIYFGSAGGEGYGSPPGGAGSGIVMVFAKTLDVYGTISSDGVAGPGSSGSGAGGSIFIKSNKLTTHSSTIEALGNTKAGAGGNGRIAIYYNALMDSLSNVNPTPYTDTLTSGADKIEYNNDWLNNSGTFTDGEEVIVSYVYNY